MWIRKYLEESNKGKWKFFFDAELENLGGQAIFRGNFDIKDSKKTKKLANNLMPRSHQSLNMFKSCLVKHGLKLFSL